MANTRYLGRFIPTVSKILYKRNIIGSLYASACNQASQASQACKSLVECGPCSKHKYMDIRCKVALVTGGSTGLGFATANELLCQEAYRVVIAHQNVESGIKAVEALEGMYGKNRACYVHLDFRRPQDYKELFKLIHKKFGGIDILVNNNWPVSPYRWEHEIDANLKNIMRATLLAFQWMPKAKKTMKGGVIVNVAGTSGLDSELVAPAFTGTNHGIVGLSKCFGNPVHFRQSGVRVVCLCPAKDNPIDPPELKEPQTFSKGVTRQAPGKVSTAVSYVIRYAPTGSVWVVENSSLYKTKIPDREKFSETIDLL